MRMMTSEPHVLQCFLDIWHLQPQDLIPELLMQRAKPANTWQHRMRTSARSAEGRGSFWAAAAAQPPSICAAWASSMLQRARGTVLCAKMCNATPVQPPHAVTCVQVAPKAFLQQLPSRLPSALPGPPACSRGHVALCCVPRCVMLHQYSHRTLSLVCRSHPKHSCSMTSSTSHEGMLFMQRGR